jgi:hypothetical protein
VLEIAMRPAAPVALQQSPEAGHGRDAPIHGKTRVTAIATKGKLGAELPNACIRLIGVI